MDDAAVRVRLDLGYDGTDFSGWAAQPGLRTVQGEIERALSTLLSGTEVPLTVAGRTDAGVHARGQVAHADLPRPLWESAGGRLLRGLAAVLPPDVRVHSVAEAPPGFDARFSATFRRYTYQVSDAPGGPDPLHRRHVLWHRRPLDAGRMNEAADALLGEHDFAAYCRKREGASTIRGLQRLTWQAQGPHRLCAHVQADAFCHNMVRALVGALLAVGEGRRSTEWPREVLDAGVRDSSVHVVPAHGLTLEEVGYPEPERMAERVRATRRVRTLTSQPAHPGRPTPRPENES
jgi:tRNA pseudouridine38-40 synthase